MYIFGDLCWGYSFWSYEFVDSKRSYGYGWSCLERVYKKGKYGIELSFVDFYYILV